MFSINYYDLTPMYLFIISSKLVEIEDEERKRGNFKECLRPLEMK
jgi:hypothetical protein